MDAEPQTPEAPRRAVAADEDPRRWRMLALLALAELLGMSLWFAASAVSGQLAERWTLSPSETAWLTSSVQLGFVLGTACSAILNLADIIPSRRLFGWSAFGGAVANTVLLVAPGFGWALACRLTTGFFLAGVYPPAMKMGATWFRAQRGLAVGTIVGALTVGKAGPYLFHAIPGVGEGPVVLSASMSAVAAALLVAAWYVDGPHAFPPRAFSWGLVGSVTRERRWRLATGGYLGHMFELYSFWTWIPAFLGASLAASGRGGPASGIVSAAAFCAIAIGGAGCIWGGFVADRRGREWLVTRAMAVSGSCAILSAAAFGGPFWVVVLLALVWGVFVIADSAQFSVLVTESVPAHAVGTALTVQTCVGFLLTLVTIQGAAVLAARIGWQWTFPGLAIGPALGIAAIRRLQAITSR